MVVVVRPVGCVAGLAELLVVDCMIVDVEVVKCVIVLVFVICTTGLLVFPVDTVDGLCLMSAPTNTTRTAA